MQKTYACTTFPPVPIAARAIQACTDGCFPVHKLPTYCTQRGPCTYLGGGLMSYGRDEIYGE